MTNIQFNARNPRIAKARLTRRTKVIVPVLAIAIAGGLGSAVYFFVQDQNVWWSFVGLALSLTNILIWIEGDVLKIKPQGQTSDTPAQLDKIIEPKLLSKLQWPMTPVQIWQQSLTCWEGVFVVKRAGIPVEVVTQLLDTNPSIDLWSPAVQLTANARLKEVDSGAVVTAILMTDIVKPVITQLKLSNEDVVSIFQWLQRLKVEMDSIKQRPAFGGIGRDWASGYTPTLSHFSKNITQEVESGYYRHIPQAHEAVVDRLVTQLAGTNPRVALIGEVGSGKTALVYSLAERLIKGEQAHGLEYYYVMELNASLLLSQGRIEETMMQVMAEAVHARNIIIFLDEAQLFFGSGTGAVDLSQVLLPVLQNSSLKLIMAMSPHDWQNLTAKNTSLASTIAKLSVNAPAPSETIKIVEDAAIGIEAQSNAVITYQSIKEVYSLAERYLTESSFPGKGITLLEAAVNYAEGGVVTAKSVQLAVEATVGTKVTAADSTEKVKLLNLEDEIHQRMVNQKRAVEVVADALRRARAGVSNPNRPAGSFLFLGPTGVGKTELARALADIYFGGQDKIVRVDMSEYQQPSDVDRLLTPSTSQAGSALVSSIRKQPFSVVLFDEIEKAHPDVLNLFLQLLDEGRLTDTDGRQASFKDAIIIATSNAAADKIREKVAAGLELEQFENEIEEELISSHQFRPELLNRFDDIVLFRPLNKTELRQVVDLMIAEVNKTLTAQKIKVSLSDEAAGKLVEDGYDPQFGARPMRRMVQRAVENVVAKKILEGSVSAGQEIVLGLNDIDSSAAKK